jgi:hypothetical protein
MQRFVSREASSLAPGDSGQLADGRAFKVVLATQLADGRCDFLGVAPLAGAEREGCPGPMPSGRMPAQEEVPISTGAPHAIQLAADQVPLPYALPD